MVTYAVPVFALMYGNPVLVQGEVCKFGHKLDKDEKCPKCRNIYFEAGNLLCR